MAARKLRVRHQDEVRTKIQASQLVNRLQKHAFAEYRPDADGNLKEFISPSQLRAIEILLKKVLPDLTATELSSDPDRPVNMGLAVVGIEPQKK